MSELPDIAPSPFEAAPQKRRTLDIEEIIWRRTVEAVQNVEA